MSTKVYTGFRLSARTMREALDSLGRVNARCEQLLTTRQAQYVAAVATRQIDKIALAGLPGYPSIPEFDATEPGTGFSPISKAWDILDDRQAEVRKTRRRDPAVDYEVIFRIWLCRDTKAFVGYVAGEGAHEFLEVLFKSRAAHEYGYWNNTDEPEHLNERQWKKRSKVWEGLIAGNSGPCFEIRVPEPRITWGLPDCVVAAIPTYESRIARYTHDLAVNRWFAEVKSVTPDINPVGQYFEFRELQQNTDSVVAGHLAAARLLVVERLASCITRELLLGK